MEGSVSIETHPMATALSGPEKMYWTVFLTKDEAGHPGGRGTTETHPMTATLSSDTFSLWAFSLQRTLGLTPGWEECLGAGAGMKSESQQIHRNAPSTSTPSGPQEICCSTIGLIRDLSPAVWEAKFFLHTALAGAFQLCFMSHYGHLQLSQG